MVQLTYWEPEPDPEYGRPAAEDIHAIGWGYTIGDLDGMARTAAIRAHTRAVDAGDRYDTAWSAIAEHLYTVETRPDRGELIRAGCDAIDRLAQDNGRHWGVNRGGSGGYESRPGYQAYWSGRTRDDGFADAVIDRIALRQILPHLSPTHQDVLYVLRDLEDPRAAAEAFGRTLVTFRSHLKNARQEFYGLWHEGETPSRLWDHSTGGRRTAIQSMRSRAQQRAAKPPKPPKPPRTHCGNGHERTPQNLSNGKCRPCAAERSREYRARQRGAT